VKRPVPQSPFPGTQALGSERSASFEEMLGTREARVLVVEKQWEAEVGWNASRFALLRPVARRVKGGDLAHRRPSYLLTRTTEVHPLHGWAAKGGQASRLVRGVWPQRRQVILASERSGAQEPCRNVTGKA
jgi:hypothetical protein